MARRQLVLLDLEFRELLESTEKAELQTVAEAIVMLRIKRREQKQHKTLRDIKYLRPGGKKKRTSKSEKELEKQKDVRS